MEQLFKRNVCIIEIESNSFCNRKCSYCLNNIYDKTKENITMPRSLFDKIIYELACVKYNRMVTFHRYNEPFFEQNEEILDRITHARKLLPEATLAVSSNADYIDQNYMRRIQSTGLNELYLQCHVENQRCLSLEDKKELLQVINRKIGSYRGKYIAKEHSVIFYTLDSGFSQLTIQIKNLHDFGADRGGLIKDLQREVIKQPCYQPLTSMTIDYNGSVTMCCNTASYIPEHKDFVLGNCNLNTLFEIYASEKAHVLRENLMNSFRTTICTYCDISNKKLAVKYRLI